MHTWGIEPFEGPGSIIAPWVIGLSQRRADPAIDAMFSNRNRALGVGERKGLFTRFQAQMGQASRAG